MEKPEEFEVKKDESLVCLFKMPLYGLKQASRKWYKKFDTFVLNFFSKEAIMIVDYNIKNKTIRIQCIYYFM